MAGNPVTVAVKKVRAQIEALGPAIAFRKIHGILNALEMQVEDGRYQRHAVSRLCEAILATAQLYDIPEESARELRELVCGVVSLAERRG
jgi:hypothetical protein